MPTLRGRFLAFAIAIALGGAGGGCTPQVPPQTVELSRAIGERVSANQASHEAFVAEYFASSRGRVEDFLQHRWIPEFLATFTRDAELMSLLEDPSLGDDERGQIVLEFAEAAVVEIERRRRELLAPLDALEAEALRELRAGYTDLHAMNVSVTGYLESIHEVSEMQEDVLRRLRLQRARDDALEQVTEVNRVLERTLEGAGEAEEILRRVRDLFDRRREEAALED